LSKSNVPENTLKNLAATARNGFEAAV
jgi:hypothetical protein